MTNNITHLNNFSPSVTDSFLFDNNIWIYLLCPLSSFDHRQQRVYSRLFQQILSIKSTVFITSLVLSEFVNRCLRFDYNQWKKHPENIQKGSDFKRDFVGSQTYKDSVENITINVNKIMSLTERYPDDFTAIDLPSILNHFKKIDFNDSYFIQMANRQNIKIVTHDADFFAPEYNIQVITGNN
jgi:predicted nucleic acid-binding protein